jgi:hypothetical protein
MKLVLLGGLLLIVSIASFSQYADTSVTGLTTDYLRKSNKQKTAGWILFGSGAGLTCIGVIAGAGSVWKDLLEGESRRTNRAGVVIATGLVSMAGSIPLFIAAGKNRRKAAAGVSFKIEKATIINSWVTSVSRYPALAIRFRL